MTRRLPASTVGATYWITTKATAINVNVTRVSSMPSRKNVRAVSNTLAPTLSPAGKQASFRIGDARRAPPV
jgi:hypothetical protein